MPRVSARTAARPEEPLIFAAPRRAAAIAVVISAITAVVFAVAGDHAALSHIQRVDSAWLRRMMSIRTPPVTVVAKIFNILLGTSCALPAAVAVDRAQRGWRRRHGIHGVPPQDAVRPADRR